MFGHLLSNNQINVKISQGKQPQFSYNSKQLAQPFLMPAKKSVINLPKVKLQTNGSSKVEQTGFPNLETIQSNQLNNDSQIDRKIIKGILKDSYSEQIIKKDQDKFNELKLKIMSERDYLTQFQNHRQFQAKQKQQKREFYNKQISQEMHLKKVLVDYIKTQEIQIDKALRQPRESSLRHKSQSFKYFYDEAQRYQEKVHNQYISYMKEEQKYVKSRNKDKISLFQRNYDLMNSQRERQQNLHKLRRDELRRGLDQQITEHRHVLANSRSNSLSGYKNIYNPISNPLDLKMDMNNKYIINQILQKQRKNKKQ